MLKIKPIQKTLDSNPDFKPGWTPLSHGGMVNPTFGSIEPIVVCRKDDTPIFDQYMIQEKPGAIIIPYDSHNGSIRIGLITQERFIPQKTYVEAVRGFGKDDETELQTAYRELFEETGMKTNGITILGRINPNTAFYRTDIPIIAARFNEIEEILNPGEDNLVEKIQKVAPYTFSDLRKLQQEGLLECGITKAAIQEFGLFMPEFYKT